MLFLCACRDSNRTLIPRWGQKVGDANRPDWSRHPNQTSALLHEPMTLPSRDSARPVGPAWRWNLMGHGA